MNAGAAGPPVAACGRRPRPRPPRRPALTAPPPPPSSPPSPLSRIIWLPATGAPGLAVPVPSIALHAVATDRDGRPPAVVCLLDEGVEDDDDGDDDDEAANRPSSSPELRFVPSPSSTTTVDAIFAALCECAALNPDAALAAEDEDGAGEWLYDAAAVEAATGGRDPLSRLPAEALDALLADQAAGGAADAE